MNSFIWLVVDSLPSQEALDNLIPLFQDGHNTDGSWGNEFIGTNLILDREEHIAYSTGKYIKLL